MRTRRDFEQHLSYLLTLEGFREAIQFETYQHRAAHCQLVTNAVESKLASLNCDTLQKITQELTDVDCDDRSHAARAKRTADDIVNRLPAARVVGQLVGLLQDMTKEDGDKLVDIVDHVLPLNYAPDVIYRLREQVSQHRFGLVENEVFSRTLAEVIMAGYDQQPARFMPSNSARAGLRGQPAIDYSGEPEGGPGQPGKAKINLLQAVRDLLYDLLALKGDVLGFQDDPPERYTDGVPSEQVLEQEIKDYAAEFQTVLTSVERGIHKGRSVYCLLALPQDQTQRDFRRQVLQEACKRVPKLVFVELMPRRQAKPDERLLYNFINNMQARLIRTL